MNFNRQELATILAALRFYQAGGQGDPDNRSDEIHAIATDNDSETSLDDAGIDALCERLNTTDTADKLAEALRAMQDAVHADNPEGLPFHFRRAAAEAGAALAEYEAAPKDGREIDRLRQDAATARELLAEVSHNGWARILHADGMQPNPLLERVEAFLSQQGGDEREAGKAAAGKHTPEPWYTGTGVCADQILNVDPRTETDQETIEDGFLADFGGNADNARRVVACVNACAEWDTETLEADPGIFNALHAEVEAARGDA